MIACRETNPRDLIHFVYDSRLLFNETIDALTEFCSRYSLTKHDMRVLEKNCNDSVEQRLLTIYHDELRFLGQGGNLGTASDILRWLEPIYSLGTYSDFDILIDTTGVPDTVTVEKPLLFNLHAYDASRYLSQIEPSDSSNTPLYCVDVNNDLISVVNKENALPMIKNIQMAIYFGCSPPAERRSYSPYLRYSRAGENTLKKLGLCCTIMDDPEQHEIRVNLTRLNLEFSARETRQLIINATKNDAIFIECMPMITNTEPVHISIDDLGRRRLAFRTEYLKYSVIYTSGAGPLALEVCGDIFYSLEKIHDVMTHSYQHYGLGHALKSNNFADAAIESSNDLSWLNQPSKTNAAGLRFFSQQNDAPELTSNHCCSIS